MAIEYVLKILLFTLVQSALSAVISIIVGGLIGRFLFWHAHAWARTIFKFFGSLTMVTPVFIPSVALVLLSHKFDVFGLWGVVTIHVFLNFSYVAIQNAETYHRIFSPARRAQIELLRLTWVQRFQLIEWPWIRHEMAHNLFLVFSNALASFTPILLLGGGPQSTTISVALYHALLVDFNLFLAGKFMVIQLLLSLGVMKLCHRIRGSVAQPAGSACSEVLAAPIYPYDKPLPTTGMTFSARTKRTVETGVLCLIACGLSFPYGVLIYSMGSFSAMDFAPLLHPIILTLALALSVGFLVLCLTIICVYCALQYPMRALSSMVDILLSIPRIVLISAIFIAFYHWFDLFLVQIMAIIGVSVLCYISYSLKGVLAMIPMVQSYRYQIHLLRFGFRETFSFIIWPLMGARIKRLASLVACFMVGNISIPLVIGQHEVKTLSICAYEAAMRFNTSATALILWVQILIMMGIYVCFNRMKSKGPAYVVY